MLLLPMLSENPHPLPLSLRARGEKHALVLKSLALRERDLG
jgi:hypothetical protein